MGQVRFLADASLNYGIVSGCLRREPAVDFLSAKAARLAGVKDPDVLRSSAEQNRILVTHDYKTMPIHFATFLSGGERCPGVFLVKQHTELGPVIEDLLIIWALSNPEEWVNRIVQIPIP